jgi:hypothetical protein
MVAGRRCKGIGSQRRRSVRRFRGRVIVRKDALHHDEREAK